MLKQSVKAFSMVLVAGVLAGCAANPGQQASHAVTHEWVTTDRVAEVQFRGNNAACRTSASSVSGYEACMSEQGYELLTP